MIRRLVSVGVVASLLIVGLYVGQQTLTQPDLTWDPAPYGFRFLADVGQDYTFTKGVIYNRGDRPIELHDVRVGSIPSGVALLGVTVALSEEFADSPLVFGPKFPPPEIEPSRAYAPNGYVVQPGKGVRLLVGLRLTSVGVHDIGPVTLDYGAALSTRSARFPYVIRICAPASDFWGPDDTVVGCDTPDPPSP